MIPFAAYSIQGFIFAVYPFVYLSEFITRIFVSKDKATIMSRDEIIAFTDMAVSHDAINLQESTIIKNVLRFSNITTEEVMTPRSVLFAAPENISIEDFLNYNNVNSFTRTPIYDKSLDLITGYVHKNDILNLLKDNSRQTLLKNCKRRIINIGEEESISKLFEQMVAQKEQIALILDEFGGTAGIVTMEDIIETLLGMEILDEHDVDSDMQLLARNRYLRHTGRISN